MCMEEGVYVYNLPSRAHSLGTLVLKSGLAVDPQFLSFSVGGRMKF
jgi:hypothetical protein